jgi:hypothetical protein
MPGSNSNLSATNGQQTTAIAKGKEENFTAAAQAATAITDREQEALVAVVATAHKTLDEAWAHECIVALSWEKEKTIAHHLER